VGRHDHAVPEGPSLVLGDHHGPASQVGEAFEHVVIVRSLSSPYHLIGWWAVADTTQRAEPSVDARWEDVLAQLATDPPDESWVTVAEASRATGLSKSTLRSWYRAGAVPSQMIAGVHGPERLVRLDAVVERSLASARGRRQLEHVRSLEAEVESLRDRVAALERHLGVR
jgi:transposase